MLPPPLQSAALSLGLVGLGQDTVLPTPIARALFDFGQGCTACFYLQTTYLHKQLFDEGELTL